METLAFIHVAANYEDPTSEPEVKALEHLNRAVPSAALIGVAGAAVAASILGGTSDKAVAASVVGAGNSGQTVESIQSALGVKVTGRYDAKTEAAVTDFQIRQGLKSIDGVVGKETGKALGLDENYRPVGYVSTYSGIGLNIRTGPGLGYYIVGGAPDGAYLYQDYESVVYNDGYAWTPADSYYGGGWVASDYTDEGYYPVSYHDGYYGDDYYGDDYYGDDYYGDDYYGGYYPVSDYGDCGCYRPVRYVCGGAYYYY